MYMHARNVIVPLSARHSKSRHIIINSISIQSPDNRPTTTILSAKMCLWCVLANKLKLNIV